MEVPPADQDISKVYYTSYRYRSDPSVSVVIYNINLPASVIENVIERRQHLEQANNLILQDFENIRNIYYQITGSYVLINPSTGAKKTWTGSFYANYINNPSIVQPFQKYDAATFVDSSFRLLDQAENILTANGENSEWMFESLTSIIFNVQVKVPTHHVIFQRRQLLSHRRYRKYFNLF